MPINPHHPFKGRHYPGEVIVLCVRWYLRYPLSYEHVTQLVAERWCRGRCQLHLALGAGICTRAEQALSAASKADQQGYRIDENHINVKGEDKYLLSSAGFHRADDRLSAHG